MSSGGGEIAVRFTSEEDARLWSAFVEVNRRAREAGAALREAGDAADKIPVAIMKYAAEVKGIPDAPLRRLNDEHAKLAKALEANLITQEEWSAGAAKAQARYQADLRRSREETERLNQSRAAIGPDGSVSAITAADVSPDAEYSAELDRLQAKLRENAITQGAYDAARQAAADEYVRKLKEIEAREQAIADKKRDQDLTKQQREEELAQRRTEQAAERAARALESEREAFARVADQARKLDATPVERLKMRQDELNDALQRGAIEQKDFEILAKKAQDAYQSELDQTGREVKKEREQFAMMAEQVRSMDATPLERLKRRQEELTAAVRRGAIEQRDYAVLAKQAQDTYQNEIKETETGWGETAAGVRAGWLAVAASVTKVLYDIQQASQQAQDAMKAAAPSRGTLAQLALTSPEKYAELTKQAEQIRASGAAATLEEANRFVFSMESAGAGKEIPLFAEAKRLGLMTDPSSMIASAAGIRESFGAERAGSFQDLINRSLVASASSPAKAEELLRGAGKAGVSARQQGIQVDELLAATSIMATAKGSADEGGSRLNALLSALSVTEPTKDAKGRIRRDSPLQASLRGRSLADIASDQTLGAMTPAQLQKALGSREAVEAFGVLKEQADKLRQLTTEIAGGVREDRLSQGLNILRRDRAITAPVQAQAAAGALEVARQQAAPTGLEIEAIIARNQRRMEIETPARVQELARAADQARRLGMAGEAKVMEAEIQRRPGQLARVNATVEANLLRGGGFFAGAVGAEERFLKFLQDANQREEEARKAANEAMERVKRAAEAMERAADKLDTRGLQVRRDLGAARREAAAAGN